MNSLFKEEDLSIMLSRIDNLRPDSQRIWGKMTAAQMLAHCNKSIETAMGKNFIKRVWFGRILGPLAKPSAINNKPFPKNSPTDKSYLFPDKLDFEKEKLTLKTTIKEFYEGGPAGCTTNAHPFFGKFTPGEWGIFTWKHLDHHLRQFGM